MAEPWFDPNTFGAWFGGLVGGVGGTLGGLLGALTGAWAPRGKGRCFILSAMAAFMVLGLVLAVTGVVALAVGQPYAIWSPCLAAGVIFDVVFGSLVPTVLHRYREAEDRRISAESIRTS
ncbi:MAG: hypothetical protein ACYC35_24510 [Pirellulales bacterium]